eukprot:458130_1
MFFKLCHLHDQFEVGFSIGNAGQNTGFGLCLLIFAFAYISGANFNPSVTIGLWVRKPNTEKTTIFMYFLMQFIGATTGGLFAWMIGGRAAAQWYPTVWQEETDYDNDFRLFQAFIAEFIFTYLYVSIYLHCIDDKRQSNNQFYGLSLGLCYAVTISAIGPISGGCINTALWFGCVLPALMTDQIGNGIGDCWIYWISPLAGGAVAGLIFKVLYGHEAEQHSNQLATGLQKSNASGGRQFTQLAE